MDFYSIFTKELLVGLLLVFLGALLTSILIRNHREQSRFDTLLGNFKRPLLLVIDILQNKKLPAKSEYVQLSDEMFAEQDRAMLIIKDRLKGKRRHIFTQKWDEYKEKREPYKNRSMTAFIQLELKKGKYPDQQFLEDDNLVKLINEILKIAKKN